MSGRHPLLLILQCGNLDLELDLALVLASCQDCKCNRAHIRKSLPADRVCGLHFEVFPSVRELAGFFGQCVGELDVVVVCGDRSYLGGSDGCGETIWIAVPEDREELCGNAGEGPVEHDKEEDGVDAVLEAEGDFGVVDVG